MGNAVLTPAPWYISRRYAILWLGGLLSFTGDMIFEFTLIVWAATRFGGSGSWRVAAIFAAATIPVIIVGPVAGTLVDQWRDKVRVIVRSSLAIAVLTALLVPLLSDGRFGIPVGDVVQTITLLLLVFIISAINQFIRPALAIVTRDIVPVEQRGQAASLRQIAMGIAILVGPPLAAPLFVTLGLTWALLLNAASFLAAAALTRIAVRGVAEQLRQVAPDPGVAPAGAMTLRDRSRPVWVDLVAGLRMVRDSPALMTMLTGLAIALVSFGILNAIDVYFVINNLGGSASIYGWFGTAQGAGTLIGAAVAGLLASRVSPVTLLWVGMIVLGVVTFIYARMTMVGAGLVLIFLFGLAFPAVNVSISPLTLRVTPRAFIGRVTGTTNTVINAAQLIGTLLGGLIFSAIGADRHLSLGTIRVGALDGLLGITGLGVIAAGLLIWRRFRAPAVRDEMDAAVGERDVPGPAATTVAAEETHSAAVR